MKRNTILAFVAIISLIMISCADKRSDNIEISQSSNFNRSTHIYSIHTKVDISNRFGFSLASNDWIVATKDASEVDEILKNQRIKADSICRNYK